MRTRRLTHNGTVPAEAVSFEGLKDAIGSTGPGAGFVDVLDAHQPFAAVRAGLQITCRGGDDRAEVERTGR